MSEALSTRTRTVSLSMVGTSMGAALAISTQEKPPAADAAAKAAEAVKKSRRFMVSCPRVIAHDHKRAGGLVQALHSPEARRRLAKCPHRNQPPLMPFRRWDAVN